MKKVYSKPDIMFEDFSLCTNIAAGGCEEPVQADGGVKWGKVYIFIEEVTGCKRKALEGMSEYNDLCYHNPSENYNAFAS